MGTYYKIRWVTSDIEHDIFWIQIKEGVASSTIYVIEVRWLWFTGCGFFGVIETCKLIDSVFLKLDNKVM